MTETMFSRIKATLKAYDYKIYTRPFELNIFGVRANSTSSNTFDDELYVFYRTTRDKWHVHYYKITTDPGTFWLLNPNIEEGTAILAQGQYEGAYEIGLHKGQYKALVQKLPVTILRDYNRNTILDFNNGIKIKGLFGINIHHAKKDGTTYKVDDFSAGCQVFQNIGDFNEFMNLCEIHARLYGNRFTYTLVDQRAIAKVTYRRLLYAASFLTTMLAGIILKTRMKKKSSKKKTKSYVNS
jgi:hypothetical protein